MDSFKANFQKDTSLVIDGWVFGQLLCEKSHSLHFVIRRVSAYAEEIVLIPISYNSTLLPQSSVNIFILNFMLLPLFGLHKYIWPACAMLAIGVK